MDVQQIFCRQFAEIINYKLDNNVIMETKLDAKLVVFMMSATLVLELLVLHQFVVLSAETLLKQDQSNVIMETKLDVKLDVLPI
jgi:hypothetical protein